ncbi:hypothetical protein GCM10010400_31060 [Streptomyces aculeolatus]
MTHAGLTAAARNPAAAGPATMLVDMLAPSRALAASRCRSGSNSPTSVNFPAFPQAVSTDEQPSSTTYVTGSRTPKAQARGTHPSRVPRSAQLAMSSRRAGSFRSHRPRSRTPAAPGSAYAASAAPTSRPSRPSGAMTMASHATATMLMPPPKSEATKAGSRRRSRGWASTGR